MLRFGLSTTVTMATGIELGESHASMIENRDIDTRPRNTAVTISVIVWHYDPVRGVRTSRRASHYCLGKEHSRSFSGFDTE